MARAYPKDPITIGNWTFCSAADLATCVERAAEMEVTLDEYLRMLAEHHHQTCCYQHFHA